MPTEEQAQLLKSAGILFPFLWAVIQTHPQGIIVKNRLSKEYRFIHAPTEKNDGLPV